MYRHLRETEPTAGNLQGDRFQGSKSCLPGAQVSLLIHSSVKGRVPLPPRVSLQVPGSLPVFCVGFSSAKT